MIALRSLLFNVLFMAWSILVQVLGMPSLLLPIAAVARIQQLWVGGSLALLAAVCGVRHEIRGWERLPPGPCVLASKHQSTWDTLIFPGLLPAPGFIIKRELRWIPLFGWYLRRTGCIEIDRKGGAMALKRMLAEARRTLAAGRYIVIFPEGTRVVPGQRKPYHPGVAALYTQLQVPVVPVALNSGLFWGRRKFLKKPGRIVLEFLEPIAPGLPRKEFTAELERRIETASARLVAEARPGT
ncbi:MAG: lysophospholipid acyltransferase family protein [Kiloniellales bacterium]